MRIAPTTEMVSALSAAASPSESDVEMSAIMKTTSMSSIVVSLGSRRWKRMIPSSARQAPAMIASPRTSSALARSEPRIDVCATTISPARSAKSTMKSSGRLPSVDCSTPVTAGPKRAPTDSVAIETTHASPASAMPDTTKIATWLSVACSSTPATAVTAATTPKTSVSLEADKAHLLVHPLERRGGCRACLVGARGEQALQLARVTSQPAEARLDRLHERHDRLADVRLELPVARVAVALLDRAHRLAGHGREDLDQVRDAGLVVAASHLAPRVGHRRPELLADGVRLVEQAHRALRRSARRRHLLRRLLQVHDPRPDLRVDALRHHERVAEAGVEPLGDVPRELEVLPLVVADRDDVGLVQQDVAGHQHRVREQAGRDEVPPVGLVLELRHPPELAEAGDGREQPTRLGVRRDVALREDRRALGVEPGGEQHRVEVERALAQVGRVVLDRDRVQVDDAEERIAALLRRRVLAEAADQVAEVLVPGG